MRCDFKVEKPAEIEFTLTMTMKLAGWQSLREQLESGSGYLSWPACDLRRAIGDMVRQAQREFEPTDSTPA